MGRLAQIIKIALRKPLSFLAVTGAVFAFRPASVGQPLNRPRAARQHLEQILALADGSRA